MKTTDLVRAGPVTMRDLMPLTHARMDDIAAEMEAIRALDYLEGRSILSEPLRFAKRMVISFQLSLGEIGLLQQRGTERNRRFNQLRVEHTHLQHEVYDLEQRSREEDGQLAPNPKLAWSDLKLGQPFEFFYVPELATRKFHRTLKDLPEFPPGFR
jgi:hypothetical protein